MDDPPTAEPAPKPPVSTPINYYTPHHTTARGMLEVVEEAEGNVTRWTLPPPSLAGHYAVVTTFLLVMVTIAAPMFLLGSPRPMFMLCIGVFLLWVAAVALWSIRTALAIHLPRIVEADACGLSVMLPTYEGSRTQIFKQHWIIQVWVRHRSMKGWQVIILTKNGGFCLPFASHWSEARARMEARLREVLQLPAESGPPPFMRRYATLAE
jgi:hypothetical protein